MNDEGEGLVQPFSKVFDEVIKSLAEEKVQISHGKEEINNARANVINELLGQAVAVVDEGIGNLADTKIMQELTQRGIPKEMAEEKVLEMSEMFRETRKNKGKRGLERDALKKRWDRGEMVVPDSFFEPDEPDLG